MLDKLYVWPGNSLSCLQLLLLQLRIIHEEREKFVKNVTFFECSLFTLRTTSSYVLLHKKWIFYNSSFCSWNFVNFFYRIQNIILLLYFSQTRVDVNIDFYIINLKCRNLRILITNCAPFSCNLKLVKISACKVCYTNYFLFLHSRECAIL